MTLAVPPTPVALSVSPARVALVAPASRRLELRNNGTSALVVDASATRAGRRPGPSLAIRPAHVVLRGGSRILLTVRVSARRGTSPGDHPLRLLLSARPQRQSRLGVRLRLGVAVRVRVRGQVVRALRLGGLRVRRRNRLRALSLTIQNNGNVAEQLRGRLMVTLVRGGKTLSRLRQRVPREVLPGTRAVVTLPYRGGVRGPVMAIVRLDSGGPRRVERRYRIRL